MNLYKIGDKIKLNRSWAKWTLENVHGCFTSPATGKIEDFATYEKTIQLAMLIILGEPPIGTIISVGSCYSASFGVYGEERLDEEHFYPASHVEVDIELSGKSLKLARRIAAVTHTPIGTVVSVILQHAYETGRLEIVKQEREGRT